MGVQACSKRAQGGPGGSSGVQGVPGGSREVQGPARVQAICWLVTMRSARPRDCSSDGLRGIMHK